MLRSEVPTSLVQPFFQKRTPLLKVEPPKTLETPQPHRCIEMYTLMRFVRVILATVTVVTNSMCSHKKLEEIVEKLR